MHSTIEPEQYPATLREHVRAVLAPMLADGLRTLPLIADAATEQVADTATRSRAKDRRRCRVRRRDGHNYGHAAGASDDDCDQFANLS